MFFIFYFLLLLSLLLDKTYLDHPAENLAKAPKTLLSFLTCQEFCDFFLSSNRSAAAAVNKAIK